MRFRYFFISFWKNKNVEDLSLLGSLKNIKYIHYFYNRKAADLWDMSGNTDLIGLSIYDFSKLHDISKIETSANLVNFQIFPLECQTALWQDAYCLRPYPANESPACADRYQPPVDSQLLV